MKTHEIINKLHTSNQTDLRDLFIDIAALFEITDRNKPLAEPLKTIAISISEQITLGVWEIDSVTTAFWVLGKAVLIPDAPDLVQLASNIIEQINTADSCYQVLIALDNQMMAKRASQRIYASIILAAFDKAPSLWNEDPQLLERVKVWLEETVMKNKPICQELPPHHP